jgi:hypothetical protein
LKVWKSLYKEGAFLRNEYIPNVPKVH